jgi:hypothetical protein
LSFPSEVYIRILRKDSKRRVENEEWWEGVYEDKIGYFPSIFVDLLNETITNSHSCIKFEQTQSEINDLSESLQNQKVPQ